MALALMCVMNNKFLTQMRDLLENNEVSHTSISVTNLLPTGLGVSVSFEIILTSTTSQDSLVAFTEYISNGLGLIGFGRYQVDQNAAVGVLAVSPTGKHYSLYVTENSA